MAKSKSAAFPFLSILGLIFITLKLIKILDWEWVWVLAPIWMPCTIMVLCLMLYAIVLYVNTFFKKNRNEKKN